MWNRHVREEPSEVDSANVWIRIRDQNEVRQHKRMEGSPPSVVAVPDNWRRGATSVEALNALAWLFIFTYLSAVQGLIHL